MRFSESTAGCAKAVSKLEPRFPTQHYGTRWCDAVAGEQSAETHHECLEISTIRHLPGLLLDEFLGRKAPRTRNTPPSSVDRDLSLRSPGLPHGESHEEAERLEHFISERFEERISAKLGHSKFDPHGHCIPTMDGKRTRQASKPLTSLQQDGKFVVDSVSDQDAPLLKRLKAHGIIPGARIQVTRRAAEEFALSTGGNARGLILPRDLAEAVRIRSGD